LVMRGESCVTSIPLFALRRTFVNNPSLNPGLSASDVALLLKDTLARYAHAFGTKAAFLTWADRQTMQADIAYRATPSMPCPLLYTSLFTRPMLQVLSDFRAS
jgi:hypothetical protein